jgi:hypothetical protein
MSVNINLDDLARIILETHIETNIPINKIIDSLTQSKNNRRKKITKILNISPSALGMYINPTSHYKQLRLLLTKSSATQLPNNKLRWNISLTKTTNNSHIPIESPPLYIYQIQTMVTSFIVDTTNITKTNCENMPITDVTGYAIPQFNYNNNYTILIDEFETQSFIARGGQKFHFTYSPFFMQRSVGNIIYYEFVSHLKSQGYYKFDKPILFPTTITITIGNPFFPFNLTLLNNITFPLVLYY